MVHYRDARIVRLVQDDPNTHRPRPPDQAFPPLLECGRQLDRRSSSLHAEHGSSANMAETEISVIDRQRLD